MSSQKCLVISHKVFRVSVIHLACIFLENSQKGYIITKALEWNFDITDMLYSSYTHITARFANNEWNHICIVIFIKAHRYKERVIAYTSFGWKNKLSIEMLPWVVGTRWIKMFILFWSHLILSTVIFNATFLNCFLQVFAHLLYMLLHLLDCSMAAG